MFVEAPVCHCSSAVDVMLMLLLRFFEFFFCEESNKREGHGKIKSCTVCPYKKESSFFQCIAKQICLGIKKILRSTTHLQRALLSSGYFFFILVHLVGTPNILLCGGEDV